MKINNVGLTPNQKSHNPFKTSRNSSTNPFQNVNFEGNTLQFADVFEGFEPKKINKLKMITSSVAGSMTKVRSLIPESIVNFVNRIREGVSNAWTYAKNTNISDLSGVKAFNNLMNTDIADIGKSIPGVKTIGNVMNTDIVDIGKGIGNTISDGMSFLNKDISEFGIKMPSLNIDLTGINNSLSTRWNALISNIHHTKATKDMPVSDLRNLWLEENARIAEREAA